MSAANIPKPWAHDALARDLADHLKAVTARMVWVDMQLGPSGSRRPDVFTIEKSYTRPKPLAYECKVSIADFRSDVTSGKWQEYLKFAGGVTFAAPAHLLKRDDLPAGAGLIVRGPNGWKTLKAPTLNPVTLTERVLMKLLIDGVHREHVVRRGRDFNEWHARKAVAAALGEEVATILRDLDAARAKVADIERHAQTRKASIEVVQQRQIEERKREMAASVEPAVARMLEALGLPTDASSWSIRNRIDELRRAIDRDHVVHDLRKALERINHSVTSALELAQADAEKREEAA